MDRRLIAAICVPTMMACTRVIGPKLMVRDRAEYSESISDSWREQMLLNIVKMRFVDPPTSAASFQVTPWSKRAA
jgi:hypothetical protein